LVVDANVWVSAAIGSEATHEASARWIAQQVAQSGPFILPTLVLPEVGGAIARRTGQAERGDYWVARIAGLAGAEFVTLDVPLALRAATLATRLKLHGPDAVYVAIADMYRVPLLTWDRQIHDRASNAIAVMRP